MIKISRTEANRMIAVKNSGLAVIHTVWLKSLGIEIAERNPDCDCALFNTELSWEDPKKMAALILIEEV